LVNDKGDRFSVDFRASAGQKDQEQIEQAVVSYFKAVGIEAKPNNVTDRQAFDVDHRNHWPGLMFNGHNITIEDWGAWYGNRTIPKPPDWNGFNVNYVAWTDPQKEKLLAQMADTLDEKQRQDLIVQFAKLFSEQLPVLPFKYAAEVTTYRTNIKNVSIRYESGGDNFRTWNAHLWEKTA